MTPLLHASRLGERPGLDRLYIKARDRTDQSFKARGLSAAVSMAKTLASKRSALPTAGNAGGAAAAYAAHARPRCVIAMARRHAIRNRANAARLGGRTLDSTA